MKLRVLEKMIMSIAVLLQLTACVKEDLKDCQVNRTNIRFEYTLHSQETDLFAEKINHVNLLVYNSKSELVASYQKLQTQLDGGNTLSITDLNEESSYTLVAWANTTEEEYVMTDASKLEDMRMSYQTIDSEKGNARPSMDSFFYGKINVNPQTRKDGQPLPMKLTNNTHKVSIKIEEVETNRPIDLSEYTVELWGKNGVFNFENNTVDSALLHYIPTYTNSQKHELIVDFNILRLLMDSDLRLKVYNSKVDVHREKPLVDLLKMSTEFQSQEDLDRVQDYNLTFTIKRNDADIQIDLIGINDWQVVNIGEDL